MGKVPWRGVVRGCYRGSVAQSAVLATMVMTHRQLGTYDHKVTRFIALTEFAKGKLASAGLPADKIRVKSNLWSGDRRPRSAHAVAASTSAACPSKKASKCCWPHCNASHPKIIKSRSWAPARSRVTPPDNWERTIWVFNLCRPCWRRWKKPRSWCCPAFATKGSRTIVEAFACGLPVIASRLGSMAELVADGETGLLFEAGNPDDLAQKIAWAHAHPHEMIAMGQRARTVYEERFNPEQNLSELIGIYRDAMAANAP